MAMRQSAVGGGRRQCHGCVRCLRFEGPEAYADLLAAGERKRGLEVDAHLANLSFGHTNHNEC